MENITRAENKRTLIKAMAYVNEQIDVRDTEWLC
jgi:hypothetical protein